MSRTVAEISGIIVGFMLGVLLLSGCADTMTADEMCTGRFGPSGPDYWQCMSYLSNREARIDGLMSELRATPPVNPLASIPPTYNTYSYRPNYYGPGREN